MAPSLGGVESLVTRCALTTHRDLGLAGRQVRPGALALDLVHGHSDSHHKRTWARQAARSALASTRWVWIWTARIDSGLPQGSGLEAAHIDFGVPREFGPALA